MPGIAPRLAVLLALWLAGQAVAQEGGLRFRADLRTGLAAHGNAALDPGGGSGSLQAQLGLLLGLSDRTRDRHFALQARGELRGTLAQGDDAALTGVVNPGLALAYGRTAAASALDLSLGARQVDLAQNRALGSTDALRGTRTDADAQLALRLGLDSRLRWGLALDHDRALFDDAPGSADRQRTELRLAADLALSQAATLSLGLARARFLADGSAARDTARLDAHLALRRPDATWTATLRLEDTPDGPRRALSLGRRVEHPDAAMRVDLGLAQGIGTHLIGALELRRTLPGLTLSTRVSRDLIARPEDDAETLATRATLDLSRQIAPATTLVFGLGYAELRRSGTDEATEDAQATASLRHRLRPGWEIDAGLGWRQRSTPGEGTARDATLHLGLTQRFERKR